MQRLSIVIPTFQEAARIAAAVRRAGEIADDVVVSDGGSSDGTVDAARDAGAIVVEGARGRGPQLHAGAIQARGDVLLFLHTDAELGPGARAAIAEALADPDVVGGNFQLRFVPDSFAARLFTWGNHVRRRLGIYYGDSGIFLRAEVYAELGGFRALPILEDYELVRRLERRGKTVYLRSSVLSASARRFARAPVRTFLVWTWIQLLYSVFGVSPARLARLYE